MRKIIEIVLITFIFLTSCNLPTSNGAGPTDNPESSNVDIVGTSVELTTAAKMAEIAGTAVPPPASNSTNVPTETLSPTPCTPLVTSTANANVRSGPDTAYEIIGFLSLGSTANISGRNDANTWWYIDNVGASGGHGWISGSVVTTSCLPSVVQVVAAPPLPPTATPTNTEVPPVAGVPDLVASGMQYWPNPAKNAQPIDIQVKVTNNGTAPSGGFSVVWLSNQDLPGCNWSVSGLGVGESKNLDCQFTYNGNATASYWTTLVVDSGGQVAESNEGNNSRDVTLKVAP